MPWLALEFEVAAAHTEVMTDVLLELGALSVSTEDAEAGTAQESALYADPTLAAAAWRRNRITALVPLQTDAAGLIAAAAHAAGLPVAPEARAARVEDEDWVRRNQEQFGPLRAGARLWVVPSWCELPRDDQAVVIRLDPGLAFGTGSHPSTRLALAWLEQSLRGGERVLDYGCGSGILALAAAKLGAARVTAVDLDAQALAACSANARANGVALEVAAPDALASGEFDVIVANILAGQLIGLAPEFAARTCRGARLALSGILAAQADEVSAAFAHDFAACAVAGEAGWTLVAGVRR
ncbi:MAG: ribosomal protein L11 methyltransferase [Betaproteobacteria bacterium RIFCSPLOWO2_12_FULL_67_28]|nr:MAG: ribosomal protein L11 methyltransferase [Betaproteobacteria bacterium RIFCSPLOWO2_02_FULL_68_150]OGA55928.1 MAG: ribosomal protein L11 methyltransferase [Betaproteobacteria bacterium RIFCSPLOWO2_12_FULL_67_28]